MRLEGLVGVETFGFDRYLNQRFYTSREWKSVRDFVITRDMGCDLGLPDYEIFGRFYIHHMNPISAKDIERSTSLLLDPEFLVCTSHVTHNAIHYGDEELVMGDLAGRSLNDTCPWKG